MSPLTKAKLTLIAFSLFAVAASQVYFAGVDAGVRAVDDDAFNAYAHFAKRMQVETHKPAHDAHKTPTDTVWAALALKGSK